MDPSRIRGMSIQNVMVREIITVRSSETVRTAWMSLMEKGISGAPVIDEEGTLVGILSLTDVYRSVIERVYKARALREAIAQNTDEETRRKEEIRAMSFSLRAVMDCPVSGLIPTDQKVFQLGPLDSLERAIRMMAENNVNRLPIVKEGKVVGIITRQDVIWVLAGRSGR
ncbi:MAG: CBS domain-containing protein [Thermoplasmata archaeon]